MIFVILFAVSVAVLAGTGALSRITRSDGTYATVAFDEDTGETVLPSRQILDAATSNGWTTYRTKLGLEFQLPVGWVPAVKSPMCGTAASETSIFIGTGGRSTEDGSKAIAHFFFFGVGCADDFRNAWGNAERVESNLRQHGSAVLNFREATVAGHRGYVFEESTGDQGRVLVVGGRTLWVSVDASAVNDPTVSRIVESVRIIQP